MDLEISGLTLGCSDCGCPTLVLVVDRTYEGVLVCCARCSCVAAQVTADWLQQFMPQLDSALRRGDPRSIESLRLPGGLGRRPEPIEVRPPDAN